MISQTTSLRIDAIPADDLARMRRRGFDDFGNPLEPTVVERFGETPLRCCLRQARLGERVALVAYRPARAGGPYAEVGPIFIHAEACPGYQAPDRYPSEFRDRPQLLRAYSSDGRIIDAAIAGDGDDAERTATSFFERPEVEYIHSRNVLWGCYMFTLRRAG